jgi:hypothetical protein
VYICHTLLECQIKDEIGGECSMQYEKLKEKDHLEDLSIDGKIKLRLFSRKQSARG